MGRKLIVKLEKDIRGSTKEKVGIGRKRLAITYYGGERGENEKVKKTLVARKTRVRKRKKILKEIMTGWP